MFQIKLDRTKILKGISRALKPGGLFLIDIDNGDFVKKNFRPRSWGKLEDGAYLLENAELTDDGTANTWTVIRKGEVQECSFFARLYSKQRMSIALKKAGLNPLRFWGDFKGHPLSSESTHLIALAQK